MLLVIGRHGVSLRNQLSLLKSRKVVLFAGARRDSGACLFATPHYTALKNKTRPLNFYDRGRT